MKYIAALLVFVVAVAAVVVSGIRPRLRAEAALVTSTQELAVPMVAVMRPAREEAVSDIVLPATVEAYIDAPIYARSSGYLTRWYHDIGAPVQVGAPLADIATPEIDQELRQAEADLATAQANLKLSQITSNRYQSLLKQDGVSQQDADNAAGDLAAKTTAVQSAQANVRRLNELLGFNRVTAPFTGVVTARDVDIGALVDAGAGAHELFHMAAIDRLRVYVSVPQDDSALLRPGLQANLMLPQFPQRRFPATLATTADAIDPTTRTLLAQFLVANPQRVLLPGSYGELHLPIAGSKASFLVPVSALLFRSEGPRLVVVENQRAVLKQVVLGRDYGINLEILAGLNGSEEVVTNPPDSVVEGETLRIGQSDGTSTTTSIGAKN